MYWVTLEQIQKLRAIFSKLANLNGYKPPLDVRQPFTENSSLLRCLPGEGAVLRGPGAVGAAEGDDAADLVDALLGPHAHEGTAGVPLADVDVLAKYSALLDLAQ